MPTFRVVESRMSEETFLVEAEDEESVRNGNYNYVTDEGSTDTWAYELKSVELVS